MTATKPRQVTNPAANEPTLSYDRVREVVMNWPPDVQAQLIQDMFNGLITRESTTPNTLEGQQDDSKDRDALLHPATDEELQERIAHGLITEPPPVGKRNSMALYGLLARDGDAPTDEEVWHMIDDERWERYSR